LWLGSVATRSAVSFGPITAASIVLFQ
jgi:hypothetical protein